MKNALLFVAVAALGGVSCDLLDSPGEWDINSREMVRKDFMRRTLPSGFITGAGHPDTVEAVDLGLSVKWADISLGQSPDNPSGDLYAWGEISPSGSYGWDSYEYNDFDPSRPGLLFINRYCFDRYGLMQDLESGSMCLDSLDDAAAMQWSDGWRMPTIEECRELATQCRWSYDEAERCAVVTGPNGNSIRFNQTYVGVGKDKFASAQGAAIPGIWSSTLSAGASPDAACLNITISPGSVSASLSSGQNRFTGLHIRPVTLK